jgi:hypothetical protein
MMVRELRCGYNNLDEGAMWSDCDVRRGEIAFQSPVELLHFDCTQNVQVRYWF